MSDEFTPPCGTTRAYRRHQRRGEEIDDACRLAYNAYVAKWRKENHERARRVANQTEKLNRRAVAIIRERYPDLYAEARKEAQREERAKQPKRES